MMDDSFREIDIGPKNIEEWGPDKKVTSVLNKDDDPRKVSVSLLQNRKLELNKKLDGLNSVFYKLDDSFEKKVYGNAIDVDGRIHEIIQLNMNAEDIHGIGITLNDLKDIILHKDQANFEFWEINTFGNIPLNNNDFLENIFPSEGDVVEVIRGTKQQRESWIKQRIPAVEVVLSDSNAIGPQPRNIGNPYLWLQPPPHPPLLPNTRLIRVPPRGATINNNFVGRPYYYFTKLLLDSYRFV